MRRLTVLVSVVSLIGVSARTHADIDACGRIMQLRCPDSCVADSQWEGCACDLAVGECTSADLQICFLDHWDFENWPNTTLIGVSDETALCARRYECRSVYGVFCAGGPISPPVGCVKAATHSSRAYYFVSLGPCPSTSADEQAVSASRP
ncbi:MAG: hypothetical protein D6744_11620 [Planctomycetota bacterium]|nr:MAG: hypothetical protein D6744_11620 [Planctomycetota bacterium]